MSPSYVFPRPELCLTAALLLSVPASPLRAQTSGSGIQDWEPVTEEQLRNPDDGDWLSYRRTYDVMGFSPLTQIDRENVDELELVWAYSVRDNNRWVPTPVVANGVMYVSEGSGRVLAFDVETGDVVWIHERSYPEDIRVSQANNKHRGVVVYDDKIYWGTADSYLVALDARTGRTVWEVQTADYHDGGGHTHPPLVADGKVLIGHAGGDLGAKGTFWAFDAQTGEPAWEFHTAPRPGDPGFDSWGGDYMEPRGAAPWNTVSYDPEFELVYFGTGQPYPWAATLRGSGDALYSNSILAVDVDTGELAWHFQLVPEDSWDRAAFESMLVDMDIRGEERRALVTTSKIGWGLVLDRETGEFLDAFRTAYDNVITGWTELGRPIYDPDAIATQEDVDADRLFEICPFYHGGRDLNSPSYSPETGLYYLGINNTCMDVSFVSEDPEARFQRGLRARPKMAPGYDYVGEFVAFDPVSGERAWEYHTESGAAMTAAALATAGGVVFGGDADRKFFALSTETGELLWETRLNGDISGAPISFEVNGKQYLAVGAGGRIAQAGSYAALTDTHVPDGGGVMWVFALP